MEATFDLRPWDELILDILVLIFMKLSLHERLIVIPRVCTSWNRAVKGPYSWQEIDINHDLSSRYEPHQIEYLVQMLITRSSGSLRKLSVYGLQTERIFTFIVENAGGSLQNLGLQRCNLNDFIVEQITEKFSMISILDLSYCMKISISAIETIGKNCKHLEVFCRKMHPSDTSVKPDENAEAFTIASTMPKLKRLEMTYNCINNDGVKKILSSCPNLEFLDLRGCWDVKLDDMNVNENFPNLHILGPQVVGYYEMEDSLDILDSSDSELDDNDIYEYNFNDGISSDEEGFDELEFNDGISSDEEGFDELEFRVHEEVIDGWN